MQAVREIRIKLDVVAYVGRVKLTLSYFPEGSPGAMVETLSFEPEDAEGLAKDLSAAAKSARGKAE